MIKSSIDDWKHRVLNSVYCTRPHEVRWHMSQEGVLSAFQELSSWNSIFLGAYNTVQSRDWNAGEGWTHDDDQPWWRPEDKKPWQEKAKGNPVDFEKGFEPPWLKSRCHTSQL